MVKIIKGTYGYYDGKKVIPINEKSGPQRLGEEVEARLVKKGVAVYVNEAPEHEPLEYDNMKLSELKEFATNTYGVDVENVRTRKEIIAMIKEKELIQDEVTESDEEPPVINASMPE